MWFLVLHIFVTLFGELVTRKGLPCVVSATAVDGLGTEGAKSSAALVLTLVSRNISASAPGGIRRRHLDYFITLYYFRYPFNVFFSTNTIAHNGSLYLWRYSSFVCSNMLFSCQTPIWSYNWPFINMIDTHLCCLNADRTNLTRYKFLIIQMESNDVNYIEL